MKSVLLGKRSLDVLNKIFTIVTMNLLLAPLVLAQEKLTLVDGSTIYGEVGAIDFKKESVVFYGANGRELIYRFEEIVEITDPNLNAQVNKHHGKVNQERNRVRLTEYLQQQRVYFQLGSQIYNDSNLVNSIGETTDGTVNLSTQGIGLIHNFTDELSGDVMLYTSFGNEIEVTDSSFSEDYFGNPVKKTEVNAIRPLADFTNYKRISNLGLQIGGLTHLGVINRGWFLSVGTGLYLERQTLAGVNKDKTQYHLSIYGKIEGGYDFGSVVLSIWGSGRAKSPAGFDDYSQMSGFKVSSKFELF